MELIKAEQLKITNNLEKLNSEINSKELILIGLHKKRDDQESFTKDISKQYDGLMARLDAMHRLTSRSTTLLITKWLIAIVLFGGGLAFTGWSMLVQGWLATVVKRSMLVIRPYLYRLNS